MNRIISYIVNMLPYMIITVPIFIIIRLIIIKVKNYRLNLKHEVLFLLFTAFLAGLASQTVIPKLEIGINGGLSLQTGGVSSVNIIPFKLLYDTYKEVFENDNINYFLINFVGNIAMFVPIGFCLPVLWSIKGRYVVLIGFLISLFIEISQLFLSRGTDIDDLILNTLGTGFGLLLYKLLKRLIKDKFRLPQKSDA